MLELQTGEFYGQLVDSDFSSFKAQIKAPESVSLLEIVPVTLVTAYDIKPNVLRIQEEIATLLARRQPPTLTPLKVPHRRTARRGQISR